jgi:hypothetical protein
LILTESFDEVVVLLVSSDPKPHRQITFPTCESTIAVSNSNRPDVPDKRLELHRRMEGIPQPELKLFSRETLGVSW